MSHLHNLRSTDPFGTQLAIETTGRVGSIAVLGAGVVRFAEQIGEPNGKQSRTAAAIGPVLEAAIACCHDQAEPLSFISVADGPGSFTGLRIGITTAKMLSYALKVPLVAVDSLASIAATVFDSEARTAANAQQPVVDLLVATDAYRGQVFCGSFHKSLLLPDRLEIDPGWSPHPENVEILESDVWAGRLAKVDTSVFYFAGDEKPFRGQPNRIIKRTQADAVGVGLLGIRAAAIGKWTDPFALVPRYLKPSAAEEKML